MSDIIEAAARALHQTLGVNDLNSAHVVVAAVAPLIRAAALEEAVQVAEDRERRRERDIDGDAYIEACRDIAFDLRAIKEQP